MLFFRICVRKFVWAGPKKEILCVLIHEIGRTKMNFVGLSCAHGLGLFLFFSSNAQVGSIKFLTFSSATKNSLMNSQNSFVAIDAL
jgi:hypothetical protein